MTVVIDYGAGNVGSVLKAIAYLGYPAEIAGSAKLLAGADKIILPGQGHFGAMMGELGRRGMIEPLREALGRGTPYLGICLGLQALYESSEEAPAVAGLGWLAGTVRRFTGPGKVPQVGWNQLEIRGGSRLLEGVANGSFVYYCHSYYAPVTAETAALTDYGGPYAAAVERGALWAVQFHPEKSGEVGLRVLQNFLAS